MFTPAVIALLFIQVVLTEMKTTPKDIMITFLGIFYVVGFLLFIPLLHGSENGKFLVWYILLAAWGTDTFAYFVGIAIGKHKFSKISPKKSIEGCIGGTLGAILVTLTYTWIINTHAGMEFEYWYIAVITLIFSVLGQIGDLSASSIKRHLEIKDFGNLLPGHGGILDRIDSIIFIAPFAYVLLTMINI